MINDAYQRMLLEIPLRFASFAGQVGREGEGGLGEEVTWGEGETGREGDPASPSRLGATLSAWGYAFSFDPTRRPHRSYGQAGRLGNRGPDNSQIRMFILLQPAQ